MAKKTEKDDALAPQSGVSEEIAPERESEQARVEIQAAYVMARRFPRNEAGAYQKLIHACGRTGFADGAVYEFPRWSSEEQRTVTISGPSVNLAREAARVWGNIRWGIFVIADSEDTRTIRGFAFDLETNAHTAHEDTFKKIGFTRKGGWEPLNERGVREHTARRGAFLVRNSILQLIPKDFIDDAMKEVEKTLAADARKEPDANKKAIVKAFDTIGVPVAELEKFIGQPLASASPEQVKKLRGVYKSIEDGNSTWADYLRTTPPEAPSTEPASKPKATTPAPASSTNDKPVPASKETAKNEAPGLSDMDKGLVGQLARKKGWAVGSGKPDDPLHTLLKQKPFEVDSVDKLKHDHLAALLNILKDGPAAAGNK